MTNMLERVILSISIVSVGALTWLNPLWLGKGNSFLQAFVNHEFLALLGVILAITLASAGQLHLALRQIELRHGKKDALKETRKLVKSSAYLLIYMFCCGLAIVLTKPLLPDEAHIASLINGAAVIVVIWTTLVLASLTEAAFAANDFFDKDI